ncbi:MAG: hypothetical protein K6F69_00310 [Treponema sp.]|nr:hypothetical protein [Treponema sp.]
MKKILAGAVAALLATSLVSAEGFKLSGLVRGGWSNIIDNLDTDGDGDGDTAESTTKTWLAGDYFGGSTRSRLNLKWDAEGDVAGAFLRYQYSGVANSWSTGDVKYAYAYVNPFGGLLTVSAGKLMDNWIGSDGYEGFSAFDGKNGFYAGVNPIEGLSIGGGAVVDYLEDTDTSDDSYKYRASKKQVYFGAKYAKEDVFSVAAAGVLAGEFYANVNINAVKDLLLAFEYDHASDDILDDGTSAYSAENTFVEQVEYTGVENLLVGVFSYQFLNDHSITNDDSNLVVTITPYAKYEINETFGASLESTITINSYDDAPDTYATIVPAFYVKANDKAKASLWALISTDTDQAKHQIGTGVSFSF